MSGGHRNITTVIDFETTGLNHVNDRVIQIGAINYEEDGGVITGKFSTLVKLPLGREIPEEVTDIIGLYDFEIAHAPTALRAFETLYSFLCNTDRLVAHNASFDLGFLSRYMNVNNYDFVCTRSLVKLIDGPELSASLRFVCERNFIDFDGDEHHDALYDCNRALHVYNTYRHIAEEYGLDYVNVLVDSAERPLKFVPSRARVVTI